MSQIAPLPTATGDTASPGAPAPAPASAPSASPSQTPEPQPSAQPNQRLIIQESGELGVFVYTVVDRTTGQVITQIPREDLQTLGREPGYLAGDVINTTA